MAPLASIPPRWKLIPLCRDELVLPLKQVADPRRSGQCYPGRYLLSALLPESQHKTTIALITGASSPLRHTYHTDET